MRIAILTDAWYPHISGVTTTVNKTIEELEKAGHLVCAVHPGCCSVTAPCPTYPQIRLALNPYSCLSKILKDFKPEAIHIVTEGPVGLAGRFYCYRHKLNFTTAFTTRFDEYIALRSPIPADWIFWALRWFHGASSGVMISSLPLKVELEAKGFANIRLWPRGVDTDFFVPGAKDFLNVPRPVFLYVGRVAVEKNLEAFLRLDLPGTKVIVGDGPALNSFKRRYPQARFMGAKRGEALARHFAAGDVFVFPSLTDTYGVVMLEAMACGLPVAAYPVRGPVDIVQDGVTGCLDEDLRAAALKALTLSPEACRQSALQFSWSRSAELFVANLVPV